MHKDDNNGPAYAYECMHCGGDAFYVPHMPKPGERIDGAAFGRVNPPHCLACQEALAGPIYASAVRPRRDN
jgi:hypothetical protein